MRQPGRGPQRPNSRRDSGKPNSNRPTSSRGGQSGNRFNKSENRDEPRFGDSPRRDSDRPYSNRPSTPRGEQSENRFNRSENREGSRFGNDSRRDSDRSFGNRPSNSRGDHSENRPQRSDNREGSRFGNDSRRDSGRSFGNKPHSRGDQSENRYNKSEGQSDFRSDERPSRPSRGGYNKGFGDKPRRTGVARGAEAYDPTTGTYRGGLLKKDGKRLHSAKHKGAEDLPSGNTVRLNRFLSVAGICSRREADKLIEQGIVTVNGKVVTQMGYQVKPSDEVRYAGDLIRSEKKVYLLLNKPKGFLTTMDDPKARKTVMDLVGNACSERIYPVGRLDRASTGVLLFTNDGDLAKKLTHATNGARKIYDVVLDKNLAKNDFLKIQQGINLEDGLVTVDNIAYVDSKVSKHIGVELHSGKNRVIRRIFETLGYEVEKLDCTSFAGLTKKNLSRGQYRFLNQKEIEFLKTR